MLEIILQFRVIFVNNNSFFSHIEASSISYETRHRKKLNKHRNMYNIRIKCGSYVTNIADSKLHLIHNITNKWFILQSKQLSINIKLSIYFKCQDITENTNKYTIIQSMTLR